MEEDIAIRVEHVSKDFVLPHEKVTKVKELFTSLLRRRTRTKEMQHALRDVSFEIKKGEFFGIVGRNGSGKSTMLKMLAGIYQPTKGKIHVNGKLVPFIELGVGFNPELTGRENVYLNGAMMGFSKKQVDAMYDDIVAFAELEDFMDQKLKNYSSGMQVRLAFSVAIKAEAEVLLVDEVLAVGDADFQRKCFDYFRELKGKKTTVILVTHDMNAIRQYCDYALLIEKGTISARGDPDQVASAYGRLFLEPDAEGKAGQASSSSRWGDGSIMYRTVDVPKMLADRNPLKIRLEAKVVESVKGVVLGFLVKNASGLPVLGTNTIEQHKVIRDVEGEGRISIEWLVPNIFSSGRYSLDVAIVHKGGASVSDWWEGAAVFDVIKEGASQFLVSPEIKVRIDV